ncbi:hypothetical protein AB0M79_34870 [Polymorphospora sp. NPDC051019]
MATRRRPGTLPWLRELATTADDFDVRQAAMEAVDTLRRSG